MRRPSLAMCSVGKSARLWEDLIAAPGGKMNGFEMKLRAALRVSVIAFSVLALMAAAASARGALPGVPSAAAAGEYAVRPACSRARAGQVGCLLLELVPPQAARRSRSAEAGSLSGGACVRPREGCEGLRPVDLHSAYGLPLRAPVPQTIAIIGIDDDSRIEKDLAVYDSEFELPGCTHANGCLRKLNGHGRPHPLPPPSAETSKETAMDVEVSHAICQNCSIVLVEAASTALSDLEEAVETAASIAGVSEISLSVGGPEPPVLPRSGAAFDQPGIVITAASGDTGYLNWSSEEAERGVTEYPASSPYVIAVGGTHLTLGPSGERAQETLWPGSGSGCSVLFAAPRWQQELTGWPGVGCGGQRAVADIAVDGDPLSGVAVYDSVKDEEGIAPGWKRRGGTSLGAPLVAAAFALAGGAHGVAYPAQTLYENATRDPSSFYDIVGGSNGECTRLLGCTTAEEEAACAGNGICVAGPGYDGPTGLGAPDGLGAFLLRRSQKITFTSMPPDGALAGGSPYEVSATASSGLPVGFSSATPSVCAVEGEAVEFLAPGSCTVAADQGGDLEWEAAPQASQTIQVGTPESTPGAAGVLSYRGALGTTEGPGLRLLSGPAVDRRTGTVSVTLATNGAGSLRWELTFANGSFGVLVGRPSACHAGLRLLHGRCRPARAVYASGSESIAKAGTIHLAARPEHVASLALRRALERRRGLLVQVLVRFQPQGGGPTATIADVIAARLSSR